MRQVWLLVVLAVTAFPVNAGVFADVPFCDAAYGGSYGALDELSSLGVIRGEPDDNYNGFAPARLHDLKVTLERLVSVEAKLRPGKGLPASSTVIRDRELAHRLRGGVFRDVPPNHWAFHAVETLAEAGVMQGYPAPPQSNPVVTQGQALRVMQRVAELLDLRNTEWDQGTIAGVDDWLGGYLQPEPSELKEHPELAPQATHTLNRYGLAVMLNSLHRAIGRRWGELPTK